MLGVQGPINPSWPSQPNTGGAVHGGALGPRVVAGIGLLALAVVALSGCSADTGLGTWGRLGLPPGASDRATTIKKLWIGSWIAAGVIGVLVWTLILWAVVRYKRTSTNEVPRQTRYNLPMEIFYTAAPFLIIGVLFFHTIIAQDKVLATVRPAHTISVVGWKWSWTFNYREAGNPAVGSDVWQSGAIENRPVLYLPVNQPVQFDLSSPDVIHSFWIPAFYFKMDVVPGRHNSFTLTPTKEGTFTGRCAELCGAYHANMVFTVRIVSEAEYEAQMNALKAAGNTGVVLGPEDARVIAGSQADAGNNGREQVPR